MCISYQGTQRWNEIEVFQISAGSVGLTSSLQHCSYVSPLLDEAERLAKYHDSEYVKCQPEYAIREYEWFVLAGAKSRHPHIDDALDLRLQSFHIGHAVCVGQGATRSNMRDVMLLGKTAIRSLVQGGVVEV